MSIRPLGLVVNLLRAEFSLFICFLQCSVLVNLLPAVFCPCVFASCGVLSLSIKVSYSVVSSFINVTSNKCVREIMTGYNDL